MSRKWLSMFAALMILFLLPVSVSAAQGKLIVTTEAEKVVLYPVGWPEGRGYRLKESCGGGYLTFDDTLSQDLALWLHSRVRWEESRIAQGNPTVFTDLEEGLYLVWGENAFDPFLIAIPWDGYYWTLEVDPDSETVPQTGDHVGLFLLVMAASGAGVTLLGRRRKIY